MNTINGWVYRLTVEMGDDETPFEAKRDNFAASLKNSIWFKMTAHSDDDELWTLWDEIKDADDVEHFDLVLNAIYDLADAERCLIVLRGLS